MKVENFRLNYGGRPIFKDADFYFEDCHLNFILGEKQTGKTALLNCIAQIDQRYQGNLVGFPKDKEIAFLAQNNRFKVDLYVADILNFAYQIQGVGNFAYPESIEKVMNIKYGELTYGQRKLVLIYLNTMVDKKLYLFDKPENGMALEHFQEIFGWMRELTEMGKTVIVTTNKLDNIHDIDHVNYIKNSHEILANSFLKIKARMAF